MLKIQTASINQLNFQDQCLYCGSSMALEVELIQNIEDLFKRFLEEWDQTIKNYKFQSWIRYYKAKAQFRTICQECKEIIIDYHKKLRRHGRDREEFLASQNLQSKNAHALHGLSLTKKST